MTVFLPERKKNKIGRRAVNEWALTASICRESFYDFAQEFWDTFVPEKPVWNWHIEYICNELQTVAERVFAGKPKEYDLIINQPPGTTKSSIASIAFPAWTWTRMISCRSMCGSYAFPLAMDLARKSRDIIKSDKYRLCFPEIILKPDQDTKTNFVNTRGGERHSFGVGGSVTGKHGHFIIVDDPLDPAMSVSELELKSTNSWMDETLSYRKVDKDISVMILIMQRLAQDDPTGSKLARIGSGAVRHICLPGELLPNVSPVECRAMYRDGLLDPSRLSAKVLAEARATLGEYGFASQFDQNPVPRGGGMFKTDLIQPGTPPLRMKRIVRNWDKAGTLKKGCFTVGTKMGEDLMGRFWVLDVIRRQLDSGARERLIQRTAVLDGRGVYVTVEQEPGSGGKESAENTVKMLKGWKASIVIPKGDKEVRALPFSSQVNIGNVFIVNSHWTATWLEEFQFFPYSKYKDQVDSASGAFTFLSKLRHRPGAL